MNRYFYFLCWPFNILFRAVKKLSRVMGAANARSRVQECGSGFSCGQDLSIHNDGFISIGAGCNFANNVQISTYKSGSLRIGQRCFVGDGNIITSAEGNIVIGDDCMIAEYVSIRAANHGIKLGSPMNVQERTIADIEIGNDVWIGRGVMICAGARVKSGCVIGANSVVTSGLVTEHNCIYAGVPAKLIKRRTR
jgi:acetyltransferase-like isoleucine patch superfamily enzyme